VTPAGKNASMPEFWTKALFCRNWPEGKKKSGGFNPGSMTNRALVPGVAWKLTPEVVRPGGELKNVKLFAGASPSKVIVVTPVVFARNSARLVNVMTAARAGVAVTSAPRATPKTKTRLRTMLPPNGMRESGQSVRPKKIAGCEFSRGCAEGTRSESLPGNRATRVIGGNGWSQGEPAHRCAVRCISQVPCRARVGTPPQRAEETGSLGPFRLNFLYR